MSRQPHANGENMPDVTSLTAEIDRLTNAVGFWNTAILVMLVFTAAAATGLVLVQRIAFKRADSLATVTERLSQLKERISDGKIAEAKKEAARANESAAILQKQTAELTSQNLNLEAAIAPRRFSAKQLKELVNVRPSGESVEIRSYGNDIEGLVLADQIFGALKSKFRLMDNRSTMQPAGNVQYGISVTGADNALVAELVSIFGSFIEPPAAPRNSGVSVGFGQKTRSIPPAAIITVGVKPIK